MTRRSSCCCSCFSCFSGRNTPSPSGLPDASAAPVDPNAPSPTEMVATGHHLQTPPSSSTSGAQGTSIEPSFSSSSAHQDASCAVVVKQDEVVLSPPSGGASSIPLAPLCAASSSSSCLPTVAMATEMVATGHHLQTPPSSSTSGAQGKSIEPSFSSSSAHQDASCAVVVNQDEVVPSPPSGGTSSIPLALLCAASSSSTVPETATSSASTRVPTVAMATDDIHHSQQSVASSSTQPGEAHSSSITNTNKDAAAVDPNAPSPTEIVAIGHHLQTPPSSSTSGAQGNSIELSSSSSSADQDASCAVVVKQDEVVPSPPSGGASSIPLALPCAASSSSTVPETATSSASSRVPTVAMATDDIHHSQQSVASSSTQPGEAHSSLQGTTSSSSITNTNKDAAGLEGDNVDVDLDALIKRISERLRLIEEGEKPPQTEGAWPTASETFSKLKDLISEGINVVTSVIPAEVIKTAVAGLGPTQLVTAGLLVVENIFERFEEVKVNKDECLRLLEEMFYLANRVRQFRERRQLKEDAVMHNLINEATKLIIEGHNRCCSQIESSKYSKYFQAKVNKGDLVKLTEEIDRMYNHIRDQMDICIYDAIDRKKAPLSRRYPDYAVGIEESVKKITNRLESASENAIAIMVHGLGGMGKSTLADAVFSSLDIRGCKYSKVQLFKHIDSKPNIVKLQKSILEDLKEEGETVPKITGWHAGQYEVGKMLERVPAFIYIDDVLGRQELEQLLPTDMKKAKKVRLLVTARDTDVRRALKVETIIVHAMKGLHPTEAVQLLKKEIKDNQLKPNQLDQIVQSYDGIPALLKVVGGFINAEEDKQEAFKILMKDKKNWESKAGEMESYVFAYNHLKSKDPFLDICSYFKGWDWDTVADIVGGFELQMLESRSLVSRGTDGVVVVQNVILSIGLEKTKKERFTFTSGKQVEELLNEKKIREIKGIWLSEKNEDLLDISASKLELLCSSIRVLALGNLIRVEGKCSQTFKELVFLQAAVPHLPFDVSQSKGLKYLKYDPMDLNFHEIPSSVSCVEFDGMLRSRALEISSGDLQHLKNLRILRLTRFVALKKLPEDLGDLVPSLQELTLSYCRSIQELPASISKLQSLRVIRMEYCSSIMQLPEDFGSLISLEKLNLQGCENLKVLPINFEKLTALKSLDLSYCERLLDLRHGFGNLTSLAELVLKECRRLRSIPESIGEMKSLASLDMSGCSSLKELPKGFHNLSFIRLLSLERCSNLEKLPDRFGELLNLRRLDLNECKNLEDLCNDFHCLASLKFLDLRECHSLKGLPQHFHCLASLSHLFLNDCPLLDGEEMDKVVKIKTLQLVDIHGSEMLVKRWGEIEREGNPLTVLTGQDLSEDRKATVEKELLTAFDSLLSNGEGEPFHLSHHLSADSLFLVIFDGHDDFDYDFPWRLFEETIDEIQTKFEIIYMGNNFNELPLKVKGKIVGHTEKDNRSVDVLVKVVSVLDVADRMLRVDKSDPNRYLEMRTKVAGDEKGANDYRPCWKGLTGREVEEFWLGKCRSYERLKELEARSRGNNIELLRELFSTGIKSSQKGASNEKGLEVLEGKRILEVLEGKRILEVLEGKRIFLDIRPLDMCYDIRLRSLMELYNTKKEALNLEVISIPLVQMFQQVSRDVWSSLQMFQEMLEQFSRDAPWLVLKKPWVLSRAAEYFLIKGSLPDQGFLLWGEECTIMYRSIITVIEPNGKVFTADKPVLPLIDRWGPKAYPFTVDNIKELEEEKSSQMETTSALELLFYNQESVLHKVKKVLLQQKMICLFGGDGSQDRISMKEFTSFLRNVLIEFIADIHIIYIIGFDFKEPKNLKLTNATYVCHSPLPNPDMPKAEMEEMPLSNILEHEAIRFWTHFYSLREMVSKRDDNAKLKSILDSIGYHIPWMILIDKDGEIIIENGQDMISLYSESMEEKAKKLMQFLIKGSKEEREEALFELEQRRCI